MADFLGIEKAGSKMFSATVLALGACRPVLSAVFPEIVEAGRYQHILNYGAAQWSTDYYIYLQKTMNKKNLSCIIKTTIFVNSFW